MFFYRCRSTAVTSSSSTPSYLLQQNLKWVTVRCVRIRLSTAAGVQLSPPAAALQVISSNSRTKSGWRSEGCEHVFLLRQQYSCHLQQQHSKLSPPIAEPKVGGDHAERCGLLRQEYSCHLQQQHSKLSPPIALAEPNVGGCQKVADTFVYCGRSTAVNSISSTPSYLLTLLTVQYTPTAAHSVSSRASQQCCL